MGGTKHDKGKNRLELIPTELIENVGKVMTHGAKKYGDYNWKGFCKSDIDRLTGAAMRHLEAYRKGEWFDEESGLPHIAHCAANCGFLLYVHSEEVHNCMLNEKNPGHREHLLGKEEEQAIQYILKTHKKLLKSMSKE